MPIHDWTRVPAGLFHHFHQTWSIHIMASLNGGLLPKGLSALVELRTGPYEGDVITVETRPKSQTFPRNGGGTAMLAPPSTRVVTKTTNEIYADRGNRVIVKHHLGRIVAVVEIMSPGNKDSRVAMEDFLAKTVELMKQGIHLTIIDLFPPSPRDPWGMHKAIWDYFKEEPFEFPAGTDRILASYEMAAEKAAYFEPVAVGDTLPDTPLFLATGYHVPLPLELTYQRTWEMGSAELRTAVETGIMPNMEE